EEIERGQAIEAFTIETDDGSGWKLLAQGTTIGAKRIVRVNHVIAARVRIRMQSSFGRPSLADVGLYLENE
ncbi:MAG TPA: hypothetical protein VI159_10325, partial [Gemmatimonadales bacterium]